MAAPIDYFECAPEVIPSSQPEACQTPTISPTSQWQIPAALPETDSTSKPPPAQANQERDRKPCRPSVGVFWAVTGALLIVVIGLAVGMGLMIQRAEDVAAASEASIKAMQASMRAASPQCTNTSSDGGLSEGSPNTSGEGLSDDQLSTMTNGCSETLAKVSNTGDYTTRDGRLTYKQWCNMHMPLSPIASLRVDNMNECMEACAKHAYKPACEAVNFGPVWRERVMVDGGPSLNCHFVNEGHALEPLGLAGALQLVQPPLNLQVHFARIVPSR